MTSWRLLLEDRLILHLYNYQEFKGRWNAPLAICQEGICNTLSILQPQAAKAAISLIKKGYIKEGTAYVDGTPRTRKIYTLTARGIVKANVLKGLLETDK